MNYHEFFLNSVGNRDNVFKYVLGLLGNNPVDILEIGCLRDLSESARRSDGWSSMHFANHILNHGGSLTICDISKNSLENCQKALESLNINKLFLLEDGIEVIKKANKHYDLVFLDGSDHPTETFDQYSEIKERANYVLCDDFHTKGRLLKSKDIEHMLFTWPKNPHELALFGGESGVMEMELIE